MPTATIISPATTGVNMRANPLFLGADEFSFAENIEFSEGFIRTRPDFRLRYLDITGTYQGSGVHTPSLGDGAKSYGPDSFSLAIAAGGKTNLVEYDGEQFGSPKEIATTGAGYVGLLSAENYLVTYGTDSPTSWWDGCEVTYSKGFEGCGDGESHDTLITDNHVNWLPHGASAMEYAHGRIHVAMPHCEGGCQVNSEVLVSDLLSKRGCCASDDILKMEEQALASYGGSLTAPSRYGSTVAFALLPLSSANGQGELVDFRQSGVVTHDTFTAPRESKFDGPQQLTQGWDTKRLTNVKLHNISSVGPRSHEVLPADLLFRSISGLHSYGFVSGIGTYQDEITNTISLPVDPLLKSDDPALLKGSSVGYWLKGNRFFVTTGMIAGGEVSVLPYAQGFASFNKGVSFTADRTPRVEWEGLWYPSKSIEGIHDFHRMGLHSISSGYGFTASTSDGEVVFSELTDEYTGKDQGVGDSPIKWAVETGAFTFSGLSTLDELSGGVLDLSLQDSFSGGKVYFRSDKTNEWQLWSEIPASHAGSLCSISLGSIPKEYREGTWFQFRIEGEGGAEIYHMTAETSKISRKQEGRNSCCPAPKKQEDYFEFRNR